MENANIRNAFPEDAPSISRLLEQLGYPAADIDKLKNKLTQLIQDPNHEVFVYDQNREIYSVVSMHIVPQLGLEDPVALLGYFVTDEEHRGAGIGREMEAHAVEMAIKHGCGRIELHSNNRRTAAHRFYQRRHFIEVPTKFFRKELGS